jgi:hypothetical protein
VCGAHRLFVEGFVCSHISVQSYALPCAPCAGGEAVHTGCVACVANNKTLVSACHLGVSHVAPLNVNARKRRKNLIS